MTIKMAFVNLNITIQTMKKACRAHANEKGWNMNYSIVESKYYWSHESWWPEMSTFILNYNLDNDAIYKWGLFDKMDIGKISTTSRNIMCSTTHEIGALCKQYLVDYLRTERLDTQPI